MKLQGRSPYEWVLLSEGCMWAVAPRAFLTNGEHTHMGTSMDIFLQKISSFSFLHSFLLVFFNFPDLSLSSLCF